MKSILLSIKPKYVADILNGEKTIEIRKTMPKCDLPITVYIYCTKDKTVLRGVSSYAYLPHPRMDGKSMMRFGKDFPILNGKVVAKFTIRKVEEIELFDTEWCDIEKDFYSGYATKTLKGKELYEKSCLNEDELWNYFDDKQGYAYHIEDLVIFDKPKELWEFMTPSNFEKYKKAYHEAIKNDCEIGTRIAEGCAFDDEIDNEVELLEMTKFSYGLIKAPQNFCYVESEE